MALFFLLGLVVVVDESPEELAFVVLVERNLVRQILGKALDQLGILVLLQIRVVLDGLFCMVVRQSKAQC